MFQIFIAVLLFYIHGVNSNVVDEELSAGISKNGEAHPNLQGGQMLSNMKTEASSNSHSKKPYPVGSFGKFDFYCHPCKKCDMDCLRL